jgi:hypothetical protein
MWQVITVEFTDEELEVADAISALRTSHHKPGRDRYGSAKRTLLQRMNIDYDGALSEMAVAKYLQRQWIGAVTFGELPSVDVSPDLQVRSTRYKSGHLILHPQDCEAHKYILALVQVADAVTLLGWLEGWEGMNDEYWQSDKTRQPCYFVPQSALHDIETIRE